MAQKRFHNYQDAVESSRLGNKLAQMIPPGRYGGFNTFNPTAGTLNFGIQHTTNPAHKTTINPGSPALNNNLGLLVSNQGTFIEEDAAITGLSVGSNAANAFTRYDVLYVEHEYVNIVGGQAAIYGVVQGIVDRSAPTLPNPLLQTIIGVIEIPQLEATLDNAVYHPALIPTLGGEEELVWESLVPNSVNGWQGALSAANRAEICLDKHGWVHMRGYIRGNTPTPTSDVCVIDIPWKYCGNQVGITINLSCGGVSSASPGTPRQLKLFGPPSTFSTTLGSMSIDRTAINSATFSLYGISYYVGTETYRRQN